jgi:hypothetical protein
MRDFSKVSPSLWHSQRFNSLPSDDGRFLHLYLLTCEHQNSAGAYRLPDAYAAADLKWHEDRYRTARADLEAADLVAFDATASVVFVRRWFKHNPPTNPSHLKGIQRVLERLPSQTVREAASAELETVQATITAAKTKAPGGNPQGNEGNPDKAWAGWKPRL